MEKFCPNCHKPNAPQAQFCRHCAAPLLSEQPPPPQPPPPPHAGPNQGQQANQQWNQQWNQGGQGTGNNYMQPTGASGRAIASLVLTICGLVLCCGPLTGIPGAVLGWMEMSAIREGRASPKGLLMAQIGLWGGIGVSVVIGIVNVLLLIPLLLSGNY
jgi:hypothetical protein